MKTLAISILYGVALFLSPLASLLLYVYLVGAFMDMTVIWLLVLWVWLLAPLNYAIYLVKNAPRWKYACMLAATFLANVVLLVVGCIDSHPDYHNEIRASVLGHALLQFITMFGVAQIAIIVASLKKKT